jgi:putative toxin-antitoxin system antitoxin component (TIGR02293 family)
MGYVTATLPQSDFGATLGLNLQTVEAGVSLDSLASFVEASGLRFADIYEVVIPSRTLKHRKARKEPLTADESDKFARLVRIYDHALKVFHTKEKALGWLTKPKHRFEERTPVQMLRTDIGGRMVDEVLGQIEYGMFG